MFLSCSSPSAPGTGDPPAPSCTGPAPAPAPLGADTYVAFAPSFVGFHGWAAAPSSGDPSASPHRVARATVYLNRKPAPASTSFPVGTILVKELEGGDVDQRAVFAMVKRGGDYNGSGAKGWEWFELKNACGGKDVRIVWRGFGPPNDGSYGGDAHGDCNSCHGSAASNDFVWSNALKLTSF